MTTDELRAKFEVFHGMSWDDIRALPVSSGTKLHLQNAYKHDFEVWQAAHASRDAEVEALKREMDDLAALVRRLAHSLDKPSGNTMLARQALDYLRRHDLQGSPMRNND